MRLDINLASQPYEDARQFWMRWGSALGAAALLTLVLLTLTITGWFNARRDHATIAEKHVMIADRDRIRANAEEFLNRPENRNTRDESLFLNELIERKAFSWTRVLEDLEKVMPPRVHLQSIHPELNEENQLELKMEIAGDSRDRALELPRRMEESHRFAQTNIVGEAYLQGNTSGDTEKFDIVAIYVPEPFVPVIESAPAKITAPAKTTVPAKSTAPAKPKSPAPKPPNTPAKGGKPHA
jgi:type IV pilus assembly protein PilN